MVQVVSFHSVARACDRSFRPNLAIIAVALSSVYTQQRVQPPKSKASPHREKKKRAQRISPDADATQALELEAPTLSARGRRRRAAAATDRWGPTRRTSRCGGSARRSSSSRPSPSSSSSPRWRRGTSRAPAPTSPSSSAASASPSSSPRWTTSPRQAAAPLPPLSSPR